jgi:hypothetical protein
MFTDPDFGPQYPKDTAKDDLYVNPIPNGYPKPEEMIWRRLKDISPKDKPPCFLKGGAGANDVI